MRARDLVSRLDHHPFKAFRIHLSDGRKIDVPISRMMVVGLSSTVVPTVWTQEADDRLVKYWRTVSFDHIVQIGDIDDTVEGKRRKRR